jgi:hypothetical protein
MIAMAFCILGLLELIGAASLNTGILKIILECEEFSLF